MVQQKADEESQKESESRHQAQPADVVQGESLAGDVAGPMSAVAGGSAHSQAARLHDSRLLAAQRYDVAREIHRLNGNAHLLRLMVVAPAQGLVQREPGDVDEDETQQPPTGPEEEPVSQSVGVNPTGPEEEPVTQSVGVNPTGPEEEPVSQSVGVNPTGGVEEPVSQSVGVNPTGPEEEPAQSSQPVGANELDEAQQPPTGPEEQPAEGSSQPVEESEELPEELGGQ